MRYNIFGFDYIPTLILLAQVVIYFLFYYFLSAFSDIKLLSQSKPNKIPNLDESLIGNEDETIS